MILSELLHALSDLVTAEPRPEAEATATALRAGADTDLPPQPSTSLATGMQRTSQIAEAHPIAGLVIAAQPWLPWQDSPAASLQPTELRAIKSIATLIGPDAPIRSETFLFGLFYQIPGSYYPLHAHEAAETYTILAGSAHWQAGDRRFSVAAGQAIHHPPNLPHAMRAGPDGFLAMWRWSGDISFDSYRMLADPQG